MIKSNVKKNLPVKFTQRNGKPATGTVFALPETKVNGTWVLVNRGGNKDRPDLVNVRIEKLQPDTSAAAAVAGATSKPVAAKPAKMSREQAVIAESLAKAAKTADSMKATAAKLKTPAKKPTVAAVKKLAAKK